MYNTVTFFHSITRWLVLMSLLYTLYRAFKGYSLKRVFSKTDNSLRHWTATIAHIQLILGIINYTQSPVVRFFWENTSEAIKHMDILFFGLIHLVLMLVAIVLITIGSAMAKRKPTDKEKFKTVLTWFGIASLIIIVAIPWPFSPFANRPYFRPL